MQLLEIVLAALIAGTLDTVVGFGGTLLLLPVLVLVAGPELAVLLSAIIPLGWNLVRIGVLGKLLDFRAAALFAVGIVPGALVGASIFDRVDPDALRVAIAVTLILFGAYYVIRLYVELPEMKGWPKWTFPVAGFVSAGISAILGAGNGPIQTMTLAASDMTPRAITATGGLLGLVTAVSRIGSYAIGGQLRSEIWIPGAMGFLGAGLGAVMGIRLARRAKDSTLELVIGGALLLAGIRLFF
jgi:uncharacterized membrane protein YfcA